MIQNLAGINTTNLTGLKNVNSNYINNYNNINSTNDISGASLNGTPSYYYGSLTSPIQSQFNYIYSVMPNYGNEIISISASLYGFQNSVLSISSTIILLQNEINSISGQLATTISGTAYNLSTLNYLLGYTNTSPLIAYSISSQIMYFQKNCDFLSNIQMNGYLTLGNYSTNVQQSDLYNIINAGPISNQFLTLSNYVLSLSGQIYNNNSYSLTLSSGINIINNEVITLSSSIYNNTNKITTLPGQVYIINNEITSLSGSINNLNSLVGYNTGLFAYNPSSGYWNLGNLYIGSNLYVYGNVLLQSGTLNNSELWYVKGTTSNIQTQINTINTTITGIQSGGGYFTQQFEYNGSYTASQYFSTGGTVQFSSGFATPPSILYGYYIIFKTTLTATATVLILKNGSTISTASITTSNSYYTVSNLNISC